MSSSLQLLPHGLSIPNVCVSEAINSQFQSNCTAFLSVDVFWELTLVVENSTAKIGGWERGGSINVFTVGFALVDVLKVIRPDQPHTVP